jgi:hypothetical protein
LKSGRNPVGDTIVFSTNFLPTNQRVDVGVRSTFVEGTRYFAGMRSLPDEATGRRDATRDRMPW